jgi:histone-lysine N-methyltransferase SUV39H
MSFNFFPTNEEEERVSRASYPSARQQSDIQRQNVPLSFKSGSRLKLDTPITQKHLSLLRQTLEAKLAGIQGPSVTPVVDCPKLLAKLAGNFVFINEYLYRPGITRIPAGFDYGCSCVNGCDRAKCDCLSQEEDSEDRIVPYKICETNNKLIVATQEFLHRRAIILECTSYCNCKGERCWNHVVQNGRTVRLEIFDTGSRGFGMFNLLSLLPFLLA